MSLDDLDERVLIFAPMGRDGALARAALSEAGLDAVVCVDVEELSAKAAAGLGALLLTQEALSNELVQRLLQLSQAQAPWSDLPLIILISSDGLTPGLRQLITTLEAQANLSVLERPVRSGTLVNAVRVALRARRRQYQLRGLLLARAQAEEAERQVRVAAENATRIRDEFLAAVAHDLKNPLGAIKGFVQLLQRRVDQGQTLDPSLLKASLNEIDAMSTKAVAQIDELLDLARLQAAQPLPLNREPVDLAALAQRCVSEYRLMAPNHPIRVQTGAAQIVGVWDSHRLERVLGNLLSNAVKYSPEDGEITVAVTREDEPEACALLRVRDHGIGIPPADLPHIFERFYRASNAGGRVGTGLGLAGVRQIVEQHGGTIAVTSEEGKGTCVTVRLPMCRPAT